MVVLAVENIDVLAEQRVITRRADLTQAALAARDTEHITSRGVARQLRLARREIQRTVGTREAPVAVRATQRGDVLAEQRHIARCADLTSAPLVTRDTQ